MWMSPNLICSDPWETVNLYKREDFSQVHHHHYPHHPHHQPHLLTIVLLIVATFTFSWLWSLSLGSWSSWSSCPDPGCCPASCLCPCPPDRAFVHITNFDCSYPSGHNTWPYMRVLPDPGHIISVHPILVLVTVFVIPGQVREELSARLRIGWRGEARVERQGWRGEARVWAPCVFLCRGQALLTGGILEEYRFFSLFL